MHQSVLPFSLLSRCGNNCFACACIHVIVKFLEIRPLDLGARQIKKHKICIANWLSVRSGGQILAFDVMGILLI